MSPVSSDVRRATRVLLTLPAALAALALAAAGQGRRAARLQARASGVEGWTGPRVLARTLLGLPLDLAGLALTAYAAFNTVRNLGYPLWYAGTDYHQAWGGPTMAGVWAVHAIGWLLCLAVLLHWPVRGIAAGQRSLDRRLTDRPEPGPRPGRTGERRATAPRGDLSGSR
ncbi:hypothetical protein [Kitasatospora sp. NPDC057015]|uniref:hypothetical protein n=1 Tax=Kitasatospora sp. NPDC057015 TaxID=3346001 RepID=UPI0036392F7F